MRRAALAVTAVVLAAQVWACRDAPSPWEPPAEEVSPGARQLTFNPGDDRSPAWSIGGDSVLYVAEGFGDLARSNGVLVSIPSEGGTAEAIFPLVQPARAGAPELLAPAVEPGTGRIAYAQILQAQGVCVGQAISCDATGSLPAAPSLQIGRLRVRAPGATTPAREDPTLSLTFDGVEFDNSRLSVRSSGSVGHALAPVPAALQRSGPASGSSLLASGGRSTGGIGRAPAARVESRTRKARRRFPGRMTPSRRRGAPTEPRSPSRGSIVGPSSALRASTWLSGLPERSWCAWRSERSGRSDDR